MASFSRAALVALLVFLSMIIDRRSSFAQWDGCGGNVWGCPGAGHPGPGAGGPAGALGALGVGLGLLGIIEQMDQPSPPPQAPAPSQPGRTGSSEATAPAGAPYATSGVDAQKAALLSQMRPLSSGSYMVSDPSAAPSTTTTVDTQKLTILNQIRPVTPVAATGIGGAGLTSDANALQAQKAAILGGLRPLGGTANAGPNSASNQLCAAAGQAAGCIGRFTPHGTTEANSAAPVPSGASQTGPMSGAIAGGLNAAATTGVDGASTQPGCSQITGYNVTVGPQGVPQVEVQSGACGSVVQAAATAANDPASISDEALSAQARVPFDTPANQGGSAAVSLPNDTGTALLLRPPEVTFVNRATVAAEIQSAQREVCTSVSDLRRRLAGYQAALSRLQKTAGAIASDRGEWEARWNETGEEAFKQLPDALLLWLDVRAAQKLTALDAEIQRALDSRINTADVNVREQYDIVFRALETQKRKILFDKEVMIKRMTEASEGLGVWELADNKDQADKFWNGLDQLLHMSLDDPPIRATLKIGAGYAEAQAIAELWYHASYDLYTEYTSWKAVADLNRSSEEYLHTVGELQRRIKDTVAQIQKAQAETRALAPPNRGCRASST
jgi:hypothetical protein